MRKLILSLALALLAGVVMAQTDFRQISYQEGLDAAKKEGKLLFVDFYTAWCGPCKLLAKSVFPRKEVGDFMNEHFVCLSIDAEKGEGVELKEKFEIKGYPTCLIITQDGQVQYRSVGGGDDWEEFLVRMKRGADVRNSMVKLEARLQSGKIKKKELARYYVVLQDASQPEKAKEMHAKLLPLLSDKEKLEMKYWEFFSRIAKPGTHDFDLILANLPRLEKDLGKEALDEYLYGKYTFYLNNYIMELVTEDTPTLETLKQGIDAIDIKDKDKLLDSYELADICVKKDGPRFVDYYDKKAKAAEKQRAVIFNRALAQVEGMSQADTERLLEAMNVFFEMENGESKLLWALMMHGLSRDIESGETK